MLKKEAAGWEGPAAEKNDGQREPGPPLVKKDGVL
jgi:hypothetical protein